MKFSVLAALAAALMSPAYAHLIMASPKPFNNPNNSPLLPSGLDYPCRGPPVGSPTSTELKVGSNQQVTFEGSTTHGGGSCQLAITMDKTPTKDSKFKVIHSVEGGCPLTPIDFSVPAELPNGDATFAWTWFNNIGNREMYMNCASVKISGGASDNSGFDKLPDMAIANIKVGAGVGCTTLEGTDAIFPNPGKSVQKAASGKFKDLCASKTPAASGAASTPAATPVVTPVASSAAPPADAITSTIHTLVTVTGTPTGNSSVTEASPAPASPTPPAQPSATSPPATGGNASCATDGEIVCNGETQFAICNHGKAVWQPVAAGTSCKNGKIAKRAFTHRAQRTAGSV
ncbi:hypothetical protein P280DRAFT_406031 [Massarina eburnea CBS 473.64]|uniref:Carbohydrate-binding module family 19 domain-containing protein n=1 Tax=Massarina eburnea CBS 473.64 TaxID=1395130 RepID=A0A6A6RUP6_9PLEO|nr:hypothetical protein P280DRAFT_406031 [Massarina eburnea CBS 473.64]